MTKSFYRRINTTQKIWFRNPCCGLNFISLLFLGMVMYDNQFEKMENNI